VKRADFILAIILVTHIALIEVSYNSFIISYSEYYFSIFDILKYIDYPLTSMNLYKTLIGNESTGIYFLCIVLQMFTLFAVLVGIQKLRLMKSSQHLYMPNYENVHNEYIDKERIFIENLIDRSQIPLIGENLIHKYSSEFALKNFSFHLRKGEFFGLLGHNGCGKTTVFKIITGEINETSGVVRYAGMEKEKMIFHHKLNQGYCPQSGSL
jgi:ABC-type transport system involved in cytochrome bd biosynthesis fused ATPase/permease subunit